MQLLAQVLSSSRHHFAAQQSSQNSIFLRYVMTDGRPGTLFPPDCNSVSLGELSNVRESHGRLVKLDSMSGSQRINQICSRNRLAYPVLPPAAFHQIVEQQGDDVIGLKECAVLINDPEPVCVSIRRDPNVGFVDPHLLPQSIQ